MNRYSGEIHINPVPVLRDNDFNNDGYIADISEVLERTISINHSISERIDRLKSYLANHSFVSEPRFNFAPGGYIEISGIPDSVLLEMKTKNLVELFDWATDKEWVKRYGRQFGLIWENGRAVNLNGEA